MIRRALILLAALWALPAVGSGSGAVSCSDISYQDNRYTICEVDAARAQLKLFLRDDKE